MWRVSYTITENLDYMTGSFSSTHTEEIEALSMGNVEGLLIQRVRKKGDAGFESLVINSIENLDDVPCYEHRHHPAGTIMAISESRDFG